MFSQVFMLFINWLVGLSCNVTNSLHTTHTKLRNLYSKECRFLLLFQKALEISCISVFALNITMCVCMCVCVFCVLI